MTTSALRRGTRPLLALFATLLAGCTERDVFDESDSSTGSATSGGPESTDTTDPTTTAGTDNSGTSDTSGTGSESDTSTDPTFVSDTTQCGANETHILELTPEEYEAWLHGEGQGASTTDASTTDASTTDASTTDASTTDASTTDASTTDASTTGTSTTDASTTDASTTGTSGADSDATTGDGWTMELCVEICVALTGLDEWSVLSCDKLDANELGNIEIQCVTSPFCEGRSHISIGSRGAVVDADPVAAWFARAAHDEAASVYAFAALGEELATLGAPTELLARVRAAAADEVRHAQAVARLAADRGGRCRSPERRAFTARSAREIAVENATEGCVRETWAALIAAHQAEHAQDPQVRAVMRVIAVDEARHAELAWAIDHWLQTTLDREAQAEVAAARAAAAAAVVSAVTTHEPALALVHAAGVPDQKAATRLCRGLAAALWAA